VRSNGHAPHTGNGKPNGLTPLRIDPADQADPPPQIKWYNAGNIIAEHLPPREWILGSTFARGFLSGLIGAGGAGKSAIRCLQYLAVATGRPLTGEHVHFQGRVAMVCLEDGLAEIQRRIGAAMLHHNIDPTEVDGQLLYCTPRGLKLMVADRFGQRAVGSLYEQLELPVDIIGLDPFVKAHSLTENDNSAMDEVISLFIQLAAEWHFAPDIVHHTRKGIGTAGDADRGRGASAVVDAGRLIRTVTTMTQAEAEIFGVSDKDRTHLVRVDDAKINLAPLDPTAMWFKLIGVPLGNTAVNPRYPRGDVVQTVERWYPPDVFDKEDFPKTQIAQIFEVLRNGLETGDPYLSDSRAAGDWAGWPICKLADKSKGQAKRILKAWIDNGVLVESEYLSEKRGHKICPGVTLNETKAREMLGSLYR
jgi:hypothetical protein